MQSLRFAEGLIWDDHQGVRLTLGGVSGMHPSKVIITLQEGNALNSQTIWWEGNHWTDGSARNFRDAKFDRITPDGWKVEMEFPNTSYRPTFTWGSCK
jgi:hypothetical protein